MTARPVAESVRRLRPALLVPPATNSRPTPAKNHRIPDASVREPAATELSNTNGATFLLAARQSGAAPQAIGTFVLPVPPTFARHPALQAV